MDDENAPNLMTQYAANGKWFVACGLHTRPTVNVNSDELDFLLKSIDCDFYIIPSQEMFPTICFSLF